MARFMDFLILVTLCFYLANLAIEDGSSASLVVPQSFIQTTTPAGIGRDENSSPKITAKEAENLINLLPATMELPARGIDKEYNFFWIHNVTAQKTRDIRSIDVEDYAINRRTADLPVWKVPGGVSYGNDRDLVTTSEIEQSRDNLRKNNANDFGIVQEH